MSNTIFLCSDQVIVKRRVNLLSNKIDILKIIRESWNYYLRHIRSIFLVMIPVFAVIDLFYALNPINIDELSDSQGIMFSLIPLILLPLYQAALIVLFKSRYDGANLTTSQCYHFGSKAFVRLLLMYIVMGIAAFCGLMLLILPGIYLIGRFCLAECFCVLEEKSYFNALSLSWAATKQHQWPIIFGYLLVIILQVLPTYFVSNLLGNLEIENVVTDFLVGAMSSILMVFVTAYVFRVYCFVKDNESKSIDVA